MDLGARLRGHGGGVGREQVLVAPTQHVLHDSGARHGIRGSQRPVQHGAQVLLELAGHGAVHAPVPGVVRAHGQLVDGEAGVRAGRLEQLHGHHAGDAELAGQQQGRLLRGGGDARVQTRGRGDHLVAHAVHLDGLHHGPRARLAGGTPGHHRGELPGKGDGLLCEQPRAVGRAGAAFEPLGGRSTGGGLRTVHEEHSLAVVAAARGLEHHGPARALAEGHQVLGRVDLRPAGVRQAQPLHGLAHHELVLCVHERIRTGPHGHALGLEGAQVLGGHVLVVEGEDVHVRREAAQGLQIGVVTGGRTVHGGHGARVRGLCEDPQLHSESGGGGGHHAGQLTAAHDADDGTGNGRIHRPRIPSHAAPSHVGVGCRHLSQNAERPRPGLGGSVAAPPRGSRGQDRPPSPSSRLRSNP